MLYKDKQKKMKERKMIKNNKKHKKIEIKLLIERKKEMKKGKGIQSGKKE